MLVALDCRERAERVAHNARHTTEQRRDCKMDNHCLSVFTLKGITTIRTPSPSTAPFPTSPPRWQHSSPPIPPRASTLSTHKTVLSVSSHKVTCTIQHENSGRPTRHSRLREIFADLIDFISTKTQLQQK